MLLMIPVITITHRRLDDVKKLSVATSFLKHDVRQLVSLEKLAFRQLTLEPSASTRVEVHQIQLKLVRKQSLLLPLTNSCEPRSIIPLSLLSRLGKYERKMILYGN
jgi:hypothetical protein